MPSRKMEEKRNLDDKTIDAETMLGSAIVSHGDIIGREFSRDSSQAKLEELAQNLKRHGYKAKVKPHRDGFYRLTTNAPVGVVLAGGVTLVGVNYPDREAHSGPSAHGYAFRQAEQRSEIQAMLGANYPTEEAHSGPSSHGYKHRMEVDREALMATMLGVSRGGRGGGGRSAISFPRGGGGRGRGAIGPVILGPSISPPVIVTSPGPGPQGGTSSSPSDGGGTSFGPDYGDAGPSYNFYSVPTSEAPEEIVETETEQDEVSGDDVEKVTMVLPSHQKDRCMVLEGRINLRKLECKETGQSKASGISAITNAVKSIAKNKIVQGLAVKAAKMSPIGPQLEAAYALKKMASGGNPLAQAKVKKIQAAAAKPNPPPAVKKDAVALKVADEILMKTNEDDAAREARKRANAGKTARSLYYHGVRSPSPKAE